MRDIMRMHNPPHPGEILSELWLDPLDLSVTHAAEALDVSRKTLSEIVNGRAAISPEMAMRLEIAFGKSAESWLAHQAAFDLWAVDQRRDALHVQKLKRNRADA
jgi:antitoxin HigA-1